MYSDRLVVHTAAVDKARKDLRHICTGANVHVVSNLEQILLLVIHVLRERGISASDWERHEKMLMEVLHNIKEYVCEHVLENFRRFETL